MQTCVLYPNTKNAQQHLFVAAAALQYVTTGSAAEAAQFRADADSFWSDTFEPFFFNWNNVAPQVRLTYHFCAATVLYSNTVFTLLVD